MTAPLGGTPACVALFGTSADPPTIGHRAVLQALADRYPRVATWASDNPLKHHGAPLAIRAELLGRVVHDLDQPRVELLQQLSSPWAIETLRTASGLWPGATLVLVVGSDLVPQIPHWRSAGVLVRQARLAVIPRQGWPLQADDLERLGQMGADIEILPLTIEASASSRIRDGGATESGAMVQIPEAIRPVLQKYRLYGSSQAPPPS
jgi:nicotinate-nucleotide adenylyltransferase